MDIRFVSVRSLSTGGAQRIGVKPTVCIWPLLMNFAQIGHDKTCMCVVEHSRQWGLVGLQLPLLPTMKVIVMHILLTPQLEVRVGGIGQIMSLRYVSISLLLK